MRRIGALVKRAAGPYRIAMLTLSLIGLALLATLAVIVGWALSGGRPTRFQGWLYDLPAGQFKMISAVALGGAVIFAVIAAPLVEALLCMARFRWVPQMPETLACTHLEVPEGALWAIFAFLAGLAGFSSWDFRTKRQTFDPSALTKQNQTAEHQAAGPVRVVIDPPPGAAHQAVVAGAFADHPSIPERLSHAEYGDEAGPITIGGKVVRGSPGASDR